MSYIKLTQPMNKIEAVLPQIIGSLVHKLPWMFCKELNI